MFRHKKGRKNNIAQMTSEYAILASIIIAALAAMQIYLKRGIQGRLRDAMDYPVREGVFNTQQYEPAYVDRVSIDDRQTEIRESMHRGGSTGRITTETYNTNITSD
jgi:hypothetical protein